MSFYKNNIILLGAALGAVAVIFGLESMVDGGSLLYSMLFFVALSQGPIAVVAATDIVESDWARPYKRIMLSVRHMIPVISLLFIVFAVTGKIDIYSWANRDHAPNFWLTRDFFAIRNIIMPLIAWVVANKYAKETLSDSGKKTPWALFWVFTYVIGQSLVAFDWVMSLEYPWLSTLFGIYFFVEAFYSGLAFAAIMTAFKYQELVDTFSEKRLKKAQMDMMTLMFGFSIFWAYQFFSQFIVMWYGNIPEEVAFFVKRQAVFGNTMLLSVLFILFFIPFWVLLSRKIKANPVYVRIVGVIIWAGLLLERWILVAPYESPTVQTDYYSGFTVSPVVAGAEVILLGVLFFMIVRADTKTVALEY